MGAEGIGVFGDVKADGLIVVHCNDKTADNLGAHGYIIILPAGNFFLTYIRHYNRKNTNFLLAKAFPKILTG